MKSYLTIILTVVSVLLAAALFQTKHSDNAQMAADAGTIGDYSNRLDTAQAQLTVRAGTLVTLSNRLDECAAAAGAVSNRLAEARSAFAGQTEQVAQLNRQITSATAENQSLSQQVVGLTNQVAKVSAQLAQTQASLAQTNQDLVQLHKDYALLDNRFRRDVAERVVVERKFNTYAEVEEQAKKLKLSPAPAVTAESIYKDLDVEVKANGEAHVIAPN